MVHHVLWMTHTGKTTTTYSATTKKIPETMSKKQKKEIARSEAEATQKI